jgi:hypothetical protein
MRGRLGGRTWKVRGALPINHLILGNKVPKRLQGGFRNASKSVLSPSVIRTSDLGSAVGQLK